METERCALCDRSTLVNGTVPTGEICWSAVAVWPSSNEDRADCERATIERVRAALAALSATRAERDEARRERDEARDAFLRCAQAIGVSYEADGCASAPGPIDEVERAIRDAVSERMGSIDRLVAVEERAKAEAVEEAIEAVTEYAKSQQRRPVEESWSVEDSLNALQRENAAWIIVDRLRSLVQP